MRFALKMNEYPTRQALRGAGGMWPGEACREAPAALAWGMPGVVP